jgi:argininosuccinate lyase
VTRSSPVSQRLQSSLSPEIQELISIPRLQRELVPGFPYMLRASTAHLLMLDACGLIDRASVREIGRALLRMEREGADAIVPNALLEDAYFNFEARLMELAGADHGGLLHVARSRNDLGATMERMRARDVLLDALDHGAQLLAALAEKGHAHADTLMTGYTHLQPAQPITFGYYLVGVGNAVRRDLDRLQQTWDRLNLCPLGAGALAGTGFRIDRHLSARLLGFDGLLTNGLDAVSSRDFAAEILAALLGASTVLSRMATDLYVYATLEFGLVDFPDSVAGTSSIMPQKKNLAFLEHMRAKPAHLLAGLTSITMAVKGTHFSNTMDGNRESMRLAWEAMNEGVIALRLGRLAASNAQPNAATMAASAAANFSCVTDLADLLVQRNGLSFREAHHVVGAVVFDALKRRIPASAIDRAMVADAMRRVAGKDLALSESDIRDSLDPRQSVERRDLPGGPAPGQVHAMAEMLADDARRHADWVSAKRDTLALAADDMEERLAALTK